MGECAQSPARQRRLLRRRELTGIAPAVGKGFYQLSSARSFFLLTSFFTHLDIGLYMKNRMIEFAPNFIALNGMITGSSIPATAARGTPINSGVIKRFAITIAAISATSAHPSKNRSFLRLSALYILPATITNTLSLLCASVFRRARSSRSLSTPE